MDGGRWGLPSLALTKIAQLKPDGDVVVVVDDDDD